MQICLLMNGNVVDNIRISLIGKWQYRIPSARFHLLMSNDVVCNPRVMCCANRGVGRYRYDIVW